MDDYYGPDLPPGYVKPEDSDEEGTVDILEKEIKRASKISSSFIGPYCPAFLGQGEGGPSAEARVDGESFIPELGVGDEVVLSSDEEIYGPMPSQAPSLADTRDLNEQKEAIERRAKNMRSQLESKHIPAVKVAEREEWMTVPDTSRRNQLSAISQCLAPPKPQPSSSSSYGKNQKYLEKDEKTAEELKKYNKSKRSESLLELHKKDRKKKAKEKEKHGKKERKAFDRDDIAVRQFTSDQVNSVIDKAKYLNSRFSGGARKYL